MEYIRRFKGNWWVTKVLSGDSHAADSLYFNTDTGAGNRSRQKYNPQWTKAIMSTEAF